MDNICYTEEIRNSIRNLNDKELTSKEWEKRFIEISEKKSKETNQRIAKEPALLAHLEELKTTKQWGMSIEEYNRVKDFTYSEYCDYLQTKYGIGLCDYMTENFKCINKKCSRVSDGLYAHHRYEDCASLLCNKERASLYPFEYQKAQNIVYCNLLEHLFLHILICEYPNPVNKDDILGSGGVLNFFVPQLNDFYTGWIPKLDWQFICLNIVKENKDTYLLLLKRFYNNYNNLSCSKYEKRSYRLFNKSALDNVRYLYNRDGSEYHRGKDWREFYNQIKQMLS
jgi:hypothetical protein